ncbi:hypothetical protein GETHLI_32540 [Geothrix limicola]|uniref:HTH cro/C1-type domain-containing protein n=1 Tax=Geothrix limicola TaxID=2927978 RepID=A0ABQ5QIQ4_9BACT|nr:helix-turn-helix transcriptional regulator [Geothrix limicola]GLH74752.1 hypothetical protein GETHLI_32540 [Geothrix limicola]
MTSSRGAYQSLKPVGRLTTLGQRIRAVRLAWGWTQGTLAKALGSAQSLISEWEKDVSRPSGASLTALAKLFHLSMPALESGKGFKIPELPGVSEGAAMSKRDIQDLRNLLPGLKEGEILQVDTLAEDAALVPLTQALAAIREAKKQGRAVWLVIGDQAKPNV